jgi:DNA-directed RNA polymerase specialized sigma24 family protein
MKTTSSAGNEQMMPPRTLPSFHIAYPLAVRAARVRARAAVATGAIQPADRPDLEQEIQTACFCALSGFDPKRASLPTYLECVASSRTASFIRSAARSPIILDPDVAELPCADPAIDELELRIDIERLLSFRSESERRLASVLMEHTPSQASTILGLARSTIYLQIRRLRQHFATAGFDRGRFAR